MVEAGASRPDRRQADPMRDQIRIIFVVETLEYLQRGGRIGKAQAFVGTLLKFKPLLAIVDGEVIRCHAFAAGPRRWKRSRRRYCTDAATWATGTVGADPGPGVR